MAQIIWTPIAVEDFESIQEYLQVKFGDQSVTKFTKRVFSFLRVLENHPDIGVTELKEKNIKSFVLTKQTTILYKVEIDAIFLIAFFDNRQKPESKKKLIDKF